MTVSEWAIETGLHVQTILWRLRQGWPTSKCLSIRRFDDKVTHEMAVAIRAEYRASVVRQVDLARKYGISQQSVSGIIRERVNYQARIA